MKLRLARTIESVAELHDGIGDFCARHEIAESTAFAVQLAVEELFTNLVRHNRGGETIQFDIERVGDHLVIHLIDHDVDLFDPAQVPAVDVTAPLAARRPGGLGLHLIHTYLDEVDYDHVDRLLRITAIKVLEE